MKADETKIDKRKKVKYVISDMIGKYVNEEQEEGSEELEVCEF